MLIWVLRTPNAGRNIKNLGYTIALYHSLIANSGSITLQYTCPQRDSITRSQRKDNLLNEKIWRSNEPPWLDIIKKVLNLNNPERDYLFSWNLPWKNYSCIFNFRRKYFTTLHDYKYYGWIRCIYTLLKINCKCKRWALVVTSNQNHWIIHLFNIFKIFNKFKIFGD